MKSLQFSIGALALAAAGFATAAPTAIVLADFGGGGTVVDFNVIPNEAAITNQYAGLGVTFGGAFLGMTNSGDTSLFNGSTIASNWKYSIGSSTGTTWTASFAAVQSIIGFFVESNAADSVTIEAFSGATSLGSVNFPNPNGAAVDFIGIRDLAGFDRISVTTATTGNGFIAIDDFRFTAANGTVSTPGTLLLAGLGLVAMGATLRRQAR